MGYLISFFLLVGLFLTGVLFLPKIKNRKAANAHFISAVFFCYLALMLYSLKENGPYDWNFHVTLPTANVSPFTFSTLILYYILPKKAKPYHLTLISLLTVGMFLSPTLSIFSRIFSHYAFHAQFLLDYAAHYLLCLFGIYLVKSGQVTAKKRNCLIGGGTLLGVALFMLILNAVFGTAFFGLSLGEDYNIYNIKAVSSPVLSAILYFIGLFAVLFAGYLVLKYVSAKETKKEEKAFAEVG